MKKQITYAEILKSVREWNVLDVAARIRFQAAFGTSVFEVIQYQEHEDLDKIAAASERFYSGPLAGGWTGRVATYQIDDSDTNPAFVIAEQFLRPNGRSYWRTLLIRDEYEGTLEELAPRMIDWLQWNTDREVVGLPSQGVGQ